MIFCPQQKWSIHQHEHWYRAVQGYKDSYYYKPLYLPLYLLLGELTCPPVHCVNLLGRARIDVMIPRVEWKSNTSTTQQSFQDSKVMFIPIPWLSVLRRISLFVFLKDTWVGIIEFC